jgi:hypothetical protein
MSIKEELERRPDTNLAKICLKVADNGFEPETAYAFHERYWRIVLRPNIFVLPPNQRDRQRNEEVLLKERMIDFLVTVPPSILIPLI